MDGVNFENVPRVDADKFYTDKKDAFSIISRYMWTGPESIVAWKQSLMSEPKNRIA